MSKKLFKSVNEFTKKNYDEMESNRLKLSELKPQSILYVKQEVSKNNTYDVESTLLEVYQVSSSYKFNKDKCSLYIASERLNNTKKFAKIEDNESDYFLLFNEMKKGKNKGKFADFVLMSTNMAKEQGIKIPKDLGENDDDEPKARRGGHNVSDDDKKKKKK